MGRVRGGLAVLGLLAPPAVLAALVWPDDGGPAAPEPSGAFRQPLDEAVSVTVVFDGVEYSVTLRPDAAGVCLDVLSGNSGSAGCGPLAQYEELQGNFGGGFDGRTTTLNSAGLTGPDTARIVVTPDDGEPVEATLVGLPGREEQVYVALVMLDGDAFARPRIGATIQALDADGDVIDEAAF